MDKKQTTNLSSSVSVKGGAKPLENIPVRSSLDEAPQTDNAVKEIIKEMKIKIKVSEKFKKR